MTIAVAVSGGADSLFTLELLRDSGHEVLAIHGHFLPPSDQTQAAVQALDAACHGMGVPFYAVDLSAQFESQVVVPFTQSYTRGLTPNPCAHCNPIMKFGLLFDAAKALGATRIATGHYATTKSKGGDIALVRGQDPIKEQSYFLSLVPKERLAQAVFPLGSWLKADVLAELDSRGLQPPVPSESQEICFIPNDDYCAFLLNKGLPLSGPGPICLEDGTKVGRHQGLWRHTTGQRRGLGVAWSEPLYVVGKDLKHNTLLVGPRDALQSSSCVVQDLNILVPQAQWPETVLARTRYRQQSFSASVRAQGSGLRITFDEPRTRPAPGQVAALYDYSGRVLAGGIITPDQS